MWDRGGGGETRHIWRRREKVGGALSCSLPIRLAELGRARGRKGQTDRQEEGASSLPQLSLSSSFLARERAMPTLPDPLLVGVSTDAPPSPALSDACSPPAPFGALSSNSSSSSKAMAAAAEEAEEAGRGGAGGGRFSRGSSETSTGGAWPPKVGFCSRRNHRRLLLGPSGFSGGLGERSPRAGFSQWVFVYAAGSAKRSFLLSDSNQAQLRGGHLEVPPGRTPCPLFGSAYRHDNNTMPPGIAGLLLRLPAEPADLSCYTPGSACC